MFETEMKDKNGAERRKEHWNNNSHGGGYAGVVVEAAGCSVWFAW